MGQAPSIAYLTLSDYLKLEANSTVKHEYAAGSIFAMTGTSERHNLISGNLFAHLHQASRTSQCRVFQSDMRVRIDSPRLKLNTAPASVVYYPDVMVCCEADDNDPNLKSKPCLIVEVLSESTERIDRGEKLHNYQSIAELQAFVLIAQDQCRVDVFSRTVDGWHYTSLSEPDQVLTLHCPNTQISLANIYERVTFEQIVQP
jgi:Uma2 family endonuclease